MMAGFMQIIEMQTSRIDEVEALIRELRDRLDDGGSSAPRRGTMTAGRDREGFYLSVIEFDSYEAAMENSNRPEVGEHAARLVSFVTPRRGSTTSTSARRGSRKTGDSGVGAATARRARGAGSGPDADESARARYGAGGVRLVGRDGVEVLADWP
jgi:hypothetical protein